MKKHIGIKNGKLYISQTILITVLGIVLVVAALGYVKYQTAGKVNDTVRPLGIAPSGIEKVPKDSDAAAEFMTEKIKEEHKNKLTVIFYYDGYVDQVIALQDAEFLKKTLEETKPYKELKELLTFKIITSGSICGVSDEKLLCEPRHLEALTRLGIEHIKIVLLNQGEFKPALDTSFGTDSVMAISTNRRNETFSVYSKRLRSEFLTLFKKSLGTSVEDNYVRGVLSCFYGNKESYKIDTGYKNCKDFKEKYPEFWKGGDL